MRLLNLRYLHMVSEEHRGRHDQNGGIDKERAVERQRRIKEVETTSGALFRRRFTDAPGLYQRRMQVQIVRHHRCAEDGNRNVDAAGVEAWQQTGDYRMDLRLGEKYFKRKATSDGRDKYEHESFDHADTKAAKPQDEQRIKRGNSDANQQRHMKQKL